MVKPLRASGKINFYLRTYQTYALQSRGYRIVSGGTDNHQVLVELSARGMTGKAAENILESAGIVVNRNVIPQDAKTPGRVSGLRLGSAGITARGMGKPEMIRIAGLMDAALGKDAGADTIARVATAVEELCQRFPVYI